MMNAMRPKATPKSGHGFRYRPEDLEPRDDAAIGSFLERNKPALDASIDKAHAEFERGEYLTLDQVMANLGAARRKRHTSGA
jgi:hypothetical protein